jgi:uncharacterized protein involved in type VI secretion and phage assembly
MTDATDRPRFTGRYRATVLANVDPMQRGRLTLSIPDVLGPIPSTWAQASSAVSGLPGATSGLFAVPPVGAAVWVEFEQGDPDKPIWTGGRWAAASDVPSAAAVPPPMPMGQNYVLQTPLQNSLSVSDAPPTPVSGGIVLKSADGSMIAVNATGIHLSTPGGASLSLIGNTVIVNKGALTVI